MPWKRFVILNSAVMLLFLSADPLRSQSQIRARVDLVVVPVTVRDGNGFLIPALEKDDFSVFEDGKRQTIINFSRDTLPLSAAIVIDDGIIGPALKRLIPVLPSVAAGFSADDEMTSFRYDHLVWRLSDFTRDQEQITRSFRELAQISDSRPVEPEQPSIYDKREDKTPLLRYCVNVTEFLAQAVPTSISSFDKPHLARLDFRPRSIPSTSYGRLLNSTK